VHECLGCEELILPEEVLRTMKLMKERSRYPVLMILLPAILSSIPLTLIPFPLVFLPASVSPLPLNDSHPIPPLLTVVPVEEPTPNEPAKALAGRLEDGVLPLRSIFNFSLIVAALVFVGLVGST
jgi:hypothetical protein